MENTLYIALSRQEALRRQVDVMANNVANMNTTGFKAQRMLFLEYLEQPDRQQDSMSFVQDFGLMRNVAPGPLMVTDNPLDVALRDRGYFAVETFAGPRYTRGGSFQMNADRELVDGNGLPVLSDQDARIIIPAAAQHVTITGNGTVMTEEGEVARMKVVTFADEQRMETLGGGLYATAQEPEVLENPQVAQGAIEGSNVQPVVEMTQMMEVVRQYQNTQKMIDGEHERIRTALQKLSRVQ
ncbi:flagellar basal-body rod protein FlgF [Indioceanicola profundi]|uniref:flagellar basal-body rod protein FlgF n=1 Tax=Indioceanicola profundi TaxID=2220096 RepID=UPI000E6AC1D4|nr:flagellar basal-body rod protein FlgF [Indioceanicola profundi]